MNGDSQSDATAADTDAIPMVDQGELLLHVSHELRNPLNAIVGFSQLLEMEAGGPLTDLQREYIERIRRGGEYLLSVLEDTLEYAKAGAGQVRVQIGAVDLSDKVLNVAAEMAPIAAEKRVTISVSGADKIYGGLADCTRLRQILINFVSNAIKYNHVGGSIVLSLAQKDDGLTRISVTDSGCGVPADRQDELFKPFHRLGAEFSGVEGSGVGLALCRRLAGLMNGAVGFSSRADEGSIFWLDLPSAEAPPSTPKIDDGKRPHLPSFTLLQIEDDRDSAHVMREFLRLLPEARWMHARTGGEGLEIAREMTPDVIVLDMRLPDLDGFDVFQALRTDPRTWRIPVIVLSANAQPEALARGAHEGMRWWLPKPLQLKVLVEALTEALTPQVNGQPQDRRAAPRYETPQLMVSIQGEEYETVNWSEGGLMAMRYSGPLKAGDEAHIQVRFGQGSAQATARVAHVDAQRGVICMAFGPMDELSAERLRRAVLQQEFDLSVDASGADGA